ncbi:MAG: hypothetical protein KGI71_06215 [Patescibacteria group bacterium]|nr:hypothetical protein [Patescibacteria group bacterium]
MQHYRLQTREYLGKVQTIGGLKNTYSPWKTLRKESADEHGGARAEAWLKGPVVGLVQRRICLGKWKLTREEALNAR